MGGYSQVRTWKDMRKTLVVLLVILKMDIFVSLQQDYYDNYQSECPDSCRLPSGACSDSCFVSGGRKVSRGSASAASSKQKIGFGLGEERSCPLMYSCPKKDSPGTCCLRRRRRKRYHCSYSECITI